MEALILKQVILYVRDMQSQVAFYCDLLGLSVSYPQLETYADEQWVVLNAGASELALHAGGHGDYGTDSPCLVFQCNNLIETRAGLLQCGVELGTIFSPAQGTQVVHGRDPEGNRFAIKHVADL